MSTGSSLAHAGVVLNVLSGQEPPLIWSKRLAKRYVDTRHPNTGISAYAYNNIFMNLGQIQFLDMENNFDNPLVTIFPWNFHKSRHRYYPESAVAHPWMSFFMIGDMLDANGKEFTQWALEELTAWGKCSYRKEDNCFIPILTDGISLEGRIWKDGPGHSTGNDIMKPYPADMPLFWAYSLAYSKTGDEFIWEMVRAIALGNRLGDIGQTPLSDCALEMNTPCSHPYGIFGFLELYKKTKQRLYLDMAQRIADNMIEDRFQKGFFVKSKKHIYTRLNCFEPLSLLHLEAAMKSRNVPVPQAWPELPKFVTGYRYKSQSYDHDIYDLTESTHLPFSLQEAAAIGNTELVRTFIQRGADVNGFDNNTLRTALHRAAMGGHKHVAEMLLQKGAYVNERDADIWVPLQFAAYYGHKDVVGLLIENGADINFSGGTRVFGGGVRRHTALNLAITRGHRDIAKLLLASPGIDINTMDEQGSPLSLALQKKQEDIAKLLIANGADVNIGNAEGKTPLFYAVENNDRYLAALLIEKRADVNVKDASGRTPIHYALAGKNQDILLLLITAAVQPDSFEYKELQKIKRLLAQGMEVNAKGPGDNTLLHFAAQTGYLHVASLLISIGADLNARNDHRQTPLQVARSRRNMDIVLLIRQAQSGTLLVIDQERLRQWLTVPEVVPDVKSVGIHDVSVANIKVSSTCMQGESIPITATIKNLGSQREVFETSLFDITDNLRLAARSTALGGLFEKNIQDKADLVFDPDTVQCQVFGGWVCIGGDVNGDGFADVLICAARWGNERGRAYLYFGGDPMDTRPDVVFTGEIEGHRLGNQSGAFGDLNLDGYADVMIGTPGPTSNDDTTDGQVNVYYGGPDMDNRVDVVLKGEVGSGEHLGLMVATGDVDNDGYIDILAGAQGYDNLRGRVYLFWGGDPFDPTPDVVFEGEAENSLFGRRIDAGGDTNGDGYADILIGARRWGDKACGRAYLFLGNTRDKIDTASDWTFTGEDEVANMGSSLDIFDLNHDGYDDVIVGARHAANASGQVYIYWGAKNFDGGKPNVILEGQANSAMGGDMIECCRLNDDPYGDILVGAWRYPDWIYDHGLAYVYYGNMKSMIDTGRDHIFAGEGGTMDMFGCQLAVGDVNKDGYTDALISAPFGNHGTGRCYLYYGPFYNTRRVTFHWDTTNASIGKHMLKVEIPPVPGEQNTEDNIKTVTVEVKDSPK
jgi:ankyrin repeat protein